MSADAFFRRLHAVVADEAARLNALDAAVGDGDHGSTMLRGLTKAVSAPDNLRAKAFMRASGGASGTLFGLILMAIEAHLETGADLHAGLAKACERICDLGEVKAGDKSMVDALYPAVEALQNKGLAASIDAARVGRDGTKDLRAQRGRAQYVEDGGRGHLDPGSVSVVLILETLAEVGDPA
ncbi:dihydroxyacetone kinase-like protein [Hoeflea halophila]|uniref:Dihydroxyacetone kinase-like protein n=1 Tax=Hoeflea halophila TaxID=714899 RepID=A0A286IHX9_9HYPH|nr:DAK2 domain-containing protein [Hoeflea halophila]SOE18969.1 dihydroxyacetone kinase-like protein [Hoeflea halophila]